LIAFLLYKLGSLLTHLLPLPLIYRFADFLADLNFLVNTRSRRAVLANLAHVFAGAPPPSPPRRVARQVFRNFARNIVDFLRLPRLDREALEREVQVQGWEWVDQARAGGRGVIFLSLHLGNWEWAGAFFALEGIHMKAVALEHGAGRVTRFFSERREAKGIEVLPLSGSTFAMLEWLRAGGAVGMIGDRDYAHQGIEAHFFGSPVVMPRAYASLALKTGAAIVFCAVVREGKGFRLHIEPPILVAPFEALPVELRVRALVEHCLRLFETAIRRNPEQWSVFVPLWEAPPAPARRSGAVAGSTA
jgi:KDO2-lipid IV(A) lauroyltransferase